MANFSDIASRPAATSPNGRAEFAAEIEAGWLQGRVAFGGLQGALGAIAMRAAVGDAPMLRALQATFVGAVQPGPARAIASVVRRGRAVVHAQCTLWSGDAPAALFVGLYGAARASKVRVDMPSPEGLQGPDALRETPYMPDRMPGFLQHYAQRWAGGAPPYSGRPYRPASLWTRLREAAPATGEPPAALATPAVREANLVAVADLPPSPALSMLESRAPGASLTWLLEFVEDPRTVDPAAWTLLHTETRHAADGYTSQTARLWDAAGRPLAVSHQTTAIFD